MILAVDIGNTHIVVGCLTKEGAALKARIAADRLKTQDEYALILENLLRLHGLQGQTMEGGIVSSVVPGLTAALRGAVTTVTGKMPLTVGAGLKTGLNIRMDTPGELGADLVVSAVAALEKYPRPTLIFDMGTATTMSLLDKSGSYVGGLIVPGVQLSLDALAGRASQLPHVGLEKPKGLIGTNTQDSMKAGAVYAGASMLDGLVDRVNELLETPVTAVATGGIAGMILPYCKREICFDPDLMLRGLWLLYCKNKK
ncbi:MAG: type III pantothenate kinase [Oscillospiraceae bacterium]|nr:type III pantothenate kinase [Oscillospiraceae bacterium]